MATSEARKGKGYEREFVEHAAQWGHEAVRAWGSDGRALGETKGVDVLVDGELRVQCKRFAKFAERYKPPEGADVVVVREDYNKTNYFIVPDELFWPMFGAYVHRPNRG